MIRLLVIKLVFGNIGMGNIDLVFCGLNFGQVFDFDWGVVYYFQKFFVILNIVFVWGDIEIIDKDCFGWFVCCEFVMYVCQIVEFLIEFFVFFLICFIIVCGYIEIVNYDVIC